MYDTILTIPLHQEFRLLPLHSIKGELQIYFLHSNRLQATYNFSCFPRPHSHLSWTESSCRTGGLADLSISRVRQDESTTGWFAQWLARAECTVFLHPYPRPEDGCLLHFMSQEHHFVSKHPAYWPWKENVSFLQSEGFWKREGVMLVVFQFKLGHKSKLFIPHNSHTLLHETMKETTRPILVYFNTIINNTLWKMKNLEQM